MRYAGMQLLLDDIKSDLSVAQAVPAMTTDGRCMRCGQKQAVTLPIGWRYCPVCVNLGRVVEGQSLFRFEAPRFPPTASLTWQGELTHAQQQASAELCASVKAQREHLLWAVTGAGKTEMLFPAIAQLLNKGGRVGVAAPRIDVVRELAPRLAQAFAHTPMAVRYGGAPWPKQDVQLTVLTTHQLLRYYHCFDLLVIDEVDAFPFAHDAALMYAAQHAVIGSMVWLSATPDQKLLQQGRRGKIGLSTLPRRFHGYPLPVPKLAWVKKVHLPQQLPQPLLDQLKKLVTTHRVLLFVPDIDWLRPIVKALRRQLNVAVQSVHAQDEAREAKVLAFRAGEIQVMVTTTILERGVTIHRCAVVVLSADSPRFGHDALIQMAGRAGRAADSPDDPVWFYVQHYTRDLQVAITTIEQLNHMKAG
ncbi:helicase-related protein [Lacticaseibacillus porcinae]|uniref:helicase-related protein n=1 Tax=Lacticaseibacillus porcinae TaxID=1123687 RepID=UPI000F7B2E1B|nr:helicase-related protein [Lacticaseibacillus porcinae]